MCQHTFLAATVNNCAVLVKGLRKWPVYKTTVNKCESKTAGFKEGQQSISSFDSNKQTQCKHSLQLFPINTLLVSPYDFYLQAPDHRHEPNSATN